MKFASDQYCTFFVLSAIALKTEGEGSSDIAFLGNRVMSSILIDNFLALFITLSLGFGQG